MSEIAYVIALLLQLLLFVAAETVYVVWLTYRLRAKGYRSPLVGVALAIPAVAGFFAGLVLFIRADTLLRTTSATFDPSLARESLASFGQYVGGTALAAALLLGAIALALPRRAIRYAGQRRVVFPWRACGYALSGLAVLLLVLEWGVGVKGIQSLRIASQVLLPALFYCFYMGFRSRTVDLAAAIDADLRPPVLYMRAFNREADGFADVPWKDVSQYSRNMFNGGIVTFEQYFAGAVNEQLGPFVALGGPEDYLPPEGAAREYADDRTWQERFALLASRASCILMEVGDSTNLQWELGWLRTAGLHPKLFVFSRPRELRGWKHLRIVAGRRVSRLVARLKGLQPVSWPAFVAITAPLGYRLPVTDPGPGAVIGIGADGTAMVLAANAVSPEDYLAPILGQLASIQ